jgi:tape measure domain-containing protein
LANKQLTARVKLNTTQAEQKLRNIAKAIDAINRAASKQSSAYNQVNSALNKSVKTSNTVKRKTDETTNSTRKWANAVGQVNNKLNGSSRSLGVIGGKLKALASTYLGVMGTKAIIGTADTITSAENKLNYVNAQNLGASGKNADGSYTQATFDATQDSMNKMYASAQKVRMGYEDMMNNVSKSMVLAGDAFDNNTDKAIRFQEIMAEAYAVGGASAQEMSSSMYQLIQALGSGTLAGDELRSVREGAPLAYQAIEKFAQGVYDCSDSLKDMASDGMISSEMVVAAIMNAGNEMDAAFAQTKIRFDQVWTQIKNAATKAFSPVAKMLSEQLTKAVDSGLVQKVTSAFNTVAKVIMIAFTIIKNGIVWIADNWNWLKYIVGAALIVIGALLIKTAAIAIWSATVTAVTWLWANKSLIIMAIVIMLLWYVWQQFTSGAISACEALVYALIIVGTVLAIIGLIVGNVAFFIIGLILLVVAFIIAGLEYVLAVIYSVGAFIYNLVVGVINAIIQVFWWMFVEPFLGIIEFILNCCMGGFDSFGGAVANLIGNIISWFLSLGQVVTKIIDAIFGTNWTAGLESLKAKVISWGKTENSITISREAPTVASMTNNALPNRIAYTDSWNKGIEHGTSAKDWMNNLGSKFQNTGKDDKTSLIDSIGNKLGLDFSKYGDGVIDPNDPKYDLSGLHDVGNGVGKIGDDTGKIADSMDLTEEDLKYLRQLAEMEWKKEYTTANIKVDMTNNNNINGESDLDGIVTKLSDKLYEELNIVANGVYA